MLEGINVLNTYEIVNPDWNDAIFPAAIFGFITLCGIALTIYILNDAESAKQAFVPTMIVILFTLFSMVVSIYDFTHLPQNKYQTRYDVIIDDNVTLNEFQSKYEIIKVEGKIYTIKERVE